MDKTGGLLGSLSSLGGLGPKDGFSFSKLFGKKQDGEEDENEATGGILGGIIGGKDGGST
jgi:hypothetical protein